MQFSEGKFGSIPEVTCLPDRLPEGGSIVKQLKRTVTGYVALANVTAPVDCEPLPPKYEQDNELPPPPPEYDQKLLTEVQQCEEGLPGNRQHRVQHGDHGVKNGDQEDSYCEQEFDSSRVRDRRRGRHSIV